MHNLTFINNIQSSRLDRAEYFPLRVIFDSSIGNNRFIGFYGGDTNLLEFTVDIDTGLVKRLQIVTCKNYKVFEKPLTIPYVIKNGSVA